jgi:catechol 2,3-dioxygenase-like lactoylglutathione lyase family enzyme
MKARSFSHVGITVSDFNRFVQFYADIFGCPLVGVSDTPPDRVRSFFHVDGPQPACKIGWVRVPGGAILEIFEFQPQLPPGAIPWNRVASRISASTSGTRRSGTTISSARASSV